MIQEDNKKVRDSSSLKGESSENSSSFLELNHNRIIVNVRRAAKNKHCKITCGKIKHVHGCV